MQSVSRQDDRLVEEYLRFQAAQALLRGCRAVVRRTDGLAAFVERFLVELFNDLRPADGAPPDLDFGPRSAAGVRLASALLAEELADAGDALALLERLDAERRTALSGWREEARAARPGATLTATDAVLSFGAMRQWLPRARYERMLRRGSPEDLVLACLRHQAMAPDAECWAAPTALFQRLHDRYAVSLEGFAAPLNANAIMCDGVAHFCSLWPDVDRPYGSLGSFFEQDLAGSAALILPPFFEPLVRRVTEQCLAACDRALVLERPTRLFLVLPPGEDPAQRRALLRSPHLRFARELRSGTHYWQTAASGDGSTGDFAVSRTATLLAVLEAGGAARESDGDLVAAWEPFLTRQLLDDGFFPCRSPTLLSAIECVEDAAGRRSTGAPGCLLYGPYLEIERESAHVAELTLEIESAPQDRLGRFEVVANTAGRFALLAETDLRAADGTAQRRRLTFQTAGHRGGLLEFRVFVEAGARLRLCGVRVGGVGR